jgi:hypothetical protein
MAAQRHVAHETDGWVRALVTEIGVERTAKALDVASATVLRVLARLPLQGGTALLVDSRFADREGLDLAS